MKYSYAVFDFDGTVARTDPGVINSVRYALERMSWPQPDTGVLRRFLGPALYWSFETLCGMDHDQATRAIELYREAYASGGMYDIELYEGVPELIDALRASGVYVAVASGKPDEFLRPILRKFGLLDRIDASAGPLLENTTTDKTAEILRVLPEGADRTRCCMIGDRSYDIEAGKALGMAAAGVAWGYGAPEEFACADFVAGSPAALEAFLLGEGS